MLGVTSGHTKDVFTTTINFGGDRSIVIEKTVLVYHDEHGTPINVESTDEKRIIYNGDFSQDSRDEFERVLHCIKEPDGLARFEKFVERHRVYRPIVIGE